MICQLDLAHNWPSKVPQKLLDEKSLLFSVQAYSKSSKYQLIKNIILNTFRKIQNRFHIYLNWAMNFISLNTCQSAFNTNVFWINSILSGIPQVYIIQELHMSYFNPNL